MEAVEDTEWSRTGTDLLKTFKKRAQSAYGPYSIFFSQYKALHKKVR